MENNFFKPTAKVIAASENFHTGEKIVTFELEYHRFNHAELMAHRAFSRNAASSRAVPVPRAIEHIKNFPAVPMRWGANQAGMQAGATVADDVAAEMLLGWETHRDITIGFVEELHRLGLHKQWAARLLEPHQIIKTVATMTEVENFFWLRCDNDAQDEIVHLAEDARAKFNAAEFRVLKEGEWHVPYFKDGYWNPDMQESLQDALAISSSCCAQVSYRKLDDSLEKAEDVYGKLINGRRVHASPFEHQATPIGENPYDEGVDNVAPVWKNGITHMDRDGAFWSGNFKGFIQHRQLIPNHVKV